MGLSSTRGWLLTHIKGVSGCAASASQHATQPVPVEQALNIEANVVIVAYPVSRTCDVRLSQKTPPGGGATASPGSPPERVRALLRDIRAATGAVLVFGAVNVDISAMVQSLRDETSHW